jgi:hypothetical protein
MKFNGLKILSLDTSNVSNVVTREIVVRGEGFVPGVSVKLARSGAPDVLATDVTVIDETQLKGRFNLAGVSGGQWNMVVSADNFSATLPNALNVAAVRIASIQPTRGVNDKPVDITVLGENFFEGTTVKLTKAGSAGIDAQFVAIVSSGQMNCRFDITDATTGFWNITIPPGTADMTLANAFDIHFASMVVRTILRNRSYHLGIETERGIVVVDIPANTFAQDLVLTMRQPETMATIDETTCKPSDVCAELFTDRNLQPEKDITLSFYYNDPFVEGLDKDKLAVSCCDRGGTSWTPIGARSYAAQNRVVCKSRHLSVFRLVQRILGLDLDNVFVYPNPYRPGSGTIYDEAAGGDGVVFDGLTSRAQLRIFTMAGELVREVDIENGNGSYFWDARNDKNEKVASGVYLYFIANPDNSGQKTKGRFSIIR